jgi:hypothetical protein
MTREIRSPASTARVPETFARAATDTRADDVWTIGLCTR